MPCPQLLDKLVYKNRVEVEIREVSRDECVVVPHVVVRKARGALAVLVFDLQN